MSVRHSKGDAKTPRIPEASAKRNMRLCISHEVLLECDESSRRFHGGFEGLRRWQIGNEVCDRFENSLIEIFLRFARRLELSLRHTQGMVAALNHVQKV